MLLRSLIAISTIALTMVSVATAATIDPRLARTLESTSPNTLVHAWVYLQDKGPQASAPKRAVVSARSEARRAKVGANTQRIAQQDAPLHAPYVDRVARRVTRVRQQSRWFNAVSVEATPAQIRALQSLPEVRLVAPIVRYRRAANATPPPAVAPPPTSEPNKSRDQDERNGGGLDYGPSLWQASVVRIPELHARGLTGKGVLIGHFDNGHRLMSHDAFGVIQIAAERDFVDHDGDTAPPPGAPDFFGAHGVSTLSVLAGYKPGQLIGPAFGADYALARTENDASETPLEEDNWVAAIEWADSLGCDIVSSSLGYLEYDQPFESLTWQDMDGHTAVITRAADLAVARGIVVVNAAGNNGAAFGGRGNTLIAPADADSALTIGGVWQPTPSDTLQWYFSSSVGPTANQPPRTKPDLAAPGAAIYIASAGATSFFGYSSGTSFACPITAGVIALLLEAQPQSTPLVIRDALRSTASRASSPDNRIGWGIVDGVAALAALESNPVAPATLSRVKALYR